MYDEEYSLEKTDVDTYTLHLSVTMQQWIDFYTTPDSNDPKTFENEWKKYEVSGLVLQQAARVAIAKSSQLRQAMEDALAMERLGLTYYMQAEIRGHANPEYSNNKYEADEDLSFLCFNIGCLHNFTFDVLSILNVRKADL